MIMTHEQAFLKAQTQLHELLAVVQQAAAEHRRTDQLERDLFTCLLQLGRTLLEGFIAQAGAGDVGPTTTAPDGQTARRLPEPHTRPYRSIFGEIPIRRHVYGTREGQKILCVPLDATLGLPEGDCSYVLEDWSQRLCLKGAFAEGAAALQDLLGLNPSVRSLEHQSRVVGAVAATFAETRPTPPPQEEGALLVLTADGKGVPMRRPASQEPRRHRRRKGEKANKKQMAYVGAIYTIDRYVRTADQVLDEVQRRARAKDRPRPRHKHVWAEMTHVVEGDVLNGLVSLFGLLATERDRRDPDRARPTVCLLDGERALWESWAEFWSDAVGILDIFHVLERLWVAAHCFHAENSPLAAAFVTARLRLLLEGKVGALIGGLRQMRTKHRLRGAKAKSLATVIGYLANNREHMKYDVYLAAGYPIGSGVAEGACRHLVKDRLEQTGMRWTVAGAQAMLYERATYLNGDWEKFYEYRIAREQHQLYDRRDQEHLHTVAV